MYAALYNKYLFDTPPGSTLEATVKSEEDTYLLIFTLEYIVTLQLSLLMDNVSPEVPTHLIVLPTLNVDGDTEEYPVLPQFTKK